MTKKVCFRWKSWRWSLHNKYNYLVLKLGILILLVGLCFRLLIFYQSGGYSPDSDVRFQRRTVGSSASPTVNLSLPENVELAPPNNGKCDLWVGEWIPNPAGPVYNKTCKWILESSVNCMMNGRPDTSYLHWRWSPRECELPQMNPKRFLELMRNKAWAFIGDSISGNLFFSLICTLSTVEEAIKVSRVKDTKSGRWVFPSYNFTVSLIWAPFLAQAAVFEDQNGVSTSEVELQLDILNTNWTEPYRNLDYVMFSSGKWFVKPSMYYENDTLLGCNFCTKRNITKVRIDAAYRKVLRNFFNYITESNHKGMVFYRTISPDHFESGYWFSGGTCNRTEPVKEGEFPASQVVKILQPVELEEFRYASAKASKKGVNLRLFDITSLSLMRPDGHPGAYRVSQPFAVDKNAKVQNDCLHWCLPGPIDSWNDLLMEMVVNS